MNTRLCLLFVCNAGLLLLPLIGVLGKFASAMVDSTFNPLHGGFKETWFVTALNFTGIMGIFTS
jgi:hypothetical protein